MKKPLLIFVLSFTLADAFAQPPDFAKASSGAPNWDSVYADYFTKYAPVDTPAWLFPMCFKNNLGEWDTVYIGHDSNAKWGTDSAFGDIPVFVDTSNFNAFFGSLGIGNTAYEVNVLNLSQDNNFTITFTKGYMPLTMYWNDGLFYSDSLPFPDLSPLPNVRGDLWCSDGNPFYNNCPVNYPLYMSDSSFGVGGLLRIDSIYFDGNGINDQQGTLLLNIVPFDKSIDAIEDQQVHGEFDLYPNPADNYLYIRSRAHIPFEFTIYNVLGEMMVKPNWITGNDIQISLGGLQSGIYFVKVTTEKNLFTRKIIKL